MTKTIWPWFLTNLRDRLAMAWRAFQGDHWADPQHINECSREMAGGALFEIHRLLDTGGIPRGTFADDHVRNLVALHNQCKAEIALMRELPT
jgi:hypothetical protein